MAQTLASQTHMFASIPGSMPIDQISSTSLPSPPLTSLASSRPRRASASPSKFNITSGTIQQPQSKKPRPTPNRNVPARGAIMTMPQLLAGEEITYTPTTHRISKAKKGKKVHACTFPGCPKIFTRAEHRKRHEANHNAHPAFSCKVDGCKKTFQRNDLLARHMERQHNMPLDTSSSRNGRSRTSVSEHGSPAGMNLRVPHLQHQMNSPTMSHTSGTMSIGSIIDHKLQSNDYRTHPMPPNLQDHMTPQPLSSAPRSLRQDMLYGISSSGDSMYSSSESCYSPVSEYLQGTQPLSHHYYTPDLVPRPGSATAAECYQSVDASPLSMGPPTPSQTWSPYESTSLGYPPTDTPCLPSKHAQYRTSSGSSGAWAGASPAGAVPFYEMAMPPQSTWPWTSSNY